MMFDSLFSVAILVPLSTLCVRLFIDSMMFHTSITSRMQKIQNLFNIINELNFRKRALTFNNQTICRLTMIINLFSNSNRYDR